MTHDELYCPVCGEPVEQLTEGYCEDCFNERQSELLLRNARFDWWESLSNEERGKFIEWAVM